MLRVSRVAASSFKGPRSPRPTTHSRPVFVAATSLTMPPAKGVLEKLLLRITAGCLAIDDPTRAKTRYQRKNFKTLLRFSFYYHRVVCEAVAKLLLDCPRDVASTGALPRDDWNYLTLLHVAASELCRQTDRQRVFAFAANFRNPRGDTPVARFVQQCHDVRNKLQSHIIERARQVILEKSDAASFMSCEEATDRLLSFVLSHRPPPGLVHDHVGPVITCYLARTEGLLQPYYAPGASGAPRSGPADDAAELEPDPSVEEPSMADPDAPSPETEEPARQTRTSSAQPGDMVLPAHSMGPLRQRLMVALLLYCAEFQPRDGSQHAPLPKASADLLERFLAAAPGVLPHLQQPKSYAAILYACGRLWRRWPGAEGLAKLTVGAVTEDTLRALPGPQLVSLGYGVFASHARLPENLLLCLAKQLKEELPAVDVTSLPQLAVMLNAYRGRLGATLHGQLMVATAERAHRDRHQIHGRSALELLYSFARAGGCVPATPAMASWREVALLDLDTPVHPMMVGGKRSNKNLSLKIDTVKAYFA